MNGSDKELDIKSFWKTVRSGFLRDAVPPDHGGEEDDQEEEEEEEDEEEERRPSPDDFKAVYWVEMGPEGKACAVRMIDSGGLEHSCSLHRGKDGFIVAEWADGMRSTLSRIAAPVVVLADTPDLRTSPTVCLSAHLESARSCAKETSIALDGETREVERTVTDAAHVPYIDLTDHLCTSELCAPILGSTLVYRDSHHLTATASALLGGPLARAMTPLLDAMDTLEG